MQTPQDQIVLSLLKSQQWLRIDEEEDVYKTPGMVFVGVRARPDIQHYRFEVGWSVFPDCVFVLWQSGNWRTTSLVVSPEVAEQFKAAYQQRWPKKVPDVDTAPPRSPEQVKELLKKSLAHFESGTSQG
jgi:hypothetical protein